MGSDGGTHGDDGVRPAEITRLAALIARSEHIVALTGAGISVPSGIPDFRSPGTGLWSKVDPMKVATIEAFHNDPQTFWDFYRPRLQMLHDIQPNAAHGTLAELERRGKCAAVITQNIDRLHQAAGTRRVIEVHGSIETSSCTSCGARWSLSELDTLFDANGIARCSSCSGLVKPDVVLFGELLPTGAIDQARKLAEGADLMLCVGSSLEVFPVAELPEQTLSAGGALAVISEGETPYDGAASVRTSGDVASILPAALAEI